MKLFELLSPSPKNIKTNNMTEDQLNEANNIQSSISRLRRDLEVITVGGADGQKKEALISFLLGARNGWAGKIIDQIEAEMQQRISELEAKLAAL